jgi:flavin-dependent dehydrogenase
MKDCWDVIVVGAGPAGSSLAARLGSAGRSVLLLDSACFPRDKMCGEFLGAGCLPLLDQIGVLDEVRREGHPAHVMRACSPGGYFFTARYPEGVCGLSLRREKLDWILVEAARRQGGVVVREGFRAEKLMMEDGRVCGVRGRRMGGEEEVLRAHVTIGADGRNSIVARGLGAFRWNPTHRRMALGLHYENVQPGPEEVEMYGGRSVYGILNYQGGGRANVSLVLKGTDFGPWKGRLADWFGSLLEELPPLRERLAPARAMESVHALAPLAHYATRVSAGGALLVGDAAAFYDPFTGEGVYMALESSRLAAKFVDQAVGTPSLSRRFLSQYEAARAASLAGRYRLQALIQAFVGCPHLADFAVKRLRSREHFAGRLMEVIGGLRPPRELFSGFPGRA